MSRGIRRMRHVEAGTVKRGEGSGRTRSSAVAIHRVLFVVTNVDSGMSYTVQVSQQLSTQVW